MKLFRYLVCLLFLFPISYSLRANLTTVPDSLNEKTLLEKALGIKKQSDFIHVDLNTRFAFHSIFGEPAGRQSAFRMDYLRLEVQGDITDRIYYKWLQHLNKSNRPGQLDNMPASIDCLGVGFRITPTLSSFLGKQYADFGGFEYDANPAEVYEYSDLGNYITCFLVGANLSWWFTPTQELRFQVVDGRSDSAEEMYGTLPENTEVAKAPLGYTLNWNGSFAEKWYTRCSFSVFHEGKKENVYFLALAAAWIQENFNMYVDLMYSAEEIDKLGILSEIIRNEKNPVRASHSEYLSLVSRINYRVLPKLNLFVKGMYETVSPSKDRGEMTKGKYRTSYGYQGGLEYFPKKDNLRFFIMYRGRQFDYSNLGKTWGHVNTHPQTLSLGFIYKIPIF